MGGTKCDLLIEQSMNGEASKAYMKGTKIVMGAFMPLFGWLKQTGKGIAKEEFMDPVKDSFLEEQTILDVVMSSEERLRGNLEGNNLLGGSINNMAELQKQVEDEQHMSKTIVFIFNKGNYIVLKMVVKGGPGN